MKQKTTLPLSSLPKKRPKSRQKAWEPRGLFGSKSVYHFSFSGAPGSNVILRLLQKESEFEH